MNNMNITSLLLIITIILIGIALIVLQILLSKRKNSWLGLILPLLSFSFSVFLTITAPHWIRYEEWTMVLIFVLTNIPTVIFSGIYLFYRKQNMNEISRMNIQDLE